MKAFVPSPRTIKALILILVLLLIFRQIEHTPNPSNTNLYRGGLSSRDLANEPFISSHPPIQQIMSHQKVIIPGAPLKSSPEIRLKSDAEVKQRLFYQHDDVNKDPHQIVNIDAQIYRKGPRPVVDSKGRVIIDNVYVLNRKVRTDRIKVILPMLNKVGIYPQVWDAFELPNDPSKGCLYSHKNIMRDVFVNNYKWALVLEDDVDFDVTFVDQLADIMHNRVKEGVDVIYLGVVNELGIEEAWNSSRTIFKKANRPSGNFGYLLSNQGAVDYHLALEQLGDNSPVDKWWDHGENSPKLNAWIIFPQIVKPHLKSPSDLRTQEMVDLWQTKFQPTLNQSTFEKLFGDGLILSQVGSTIKHITDGKLALDNGKKHITDGKLALDNDKKGSINKEFTCTSYVVKSGDNFDLIAAAHGLTVKNLRSKNPDIQNLYADETILCV